MLDAAAAAPGPQPDIASLCRVHGLAAIQRLVAILDGPDAAASVAAACELLTRGYGQPPLTVAFDGSGITVEVNAGGEDLHRANGEGHASWNAR